MTASASTHPTGSAREAVQGCGGRLTRFVDLLEDGIGVAHIDGGDQDEFDPFSFPSAQPLTTTRKRGKERTGQRHVYRHLERLALDDLYARAARDGRDPGCDRVHAV
jgi:hypothetical protein